MTLYASAASFIQPTPDAWSGRNVVSPCALLVVTSATLRARWRWIWVNSSTDCWANSVADPIRVRYRRPAWGRFRRRRKEVAGPVQLSTVPSLGPRGRHGNDHWYCGRRTVHGAATGRSRRRPRAVDRDVAHAGRAAYGRGVRGRTADDRGA